MVRNLRNYDVFISSPSDVAAERDIVQEAIEQINQITGSKNGFRLNPIRWEVNVSSQIGKSPQDIINDQMGDEYDIFVGILCNRFGQATDSYKSGTEEEFFRAYKRLGEENSSLEILFYFKDARKSELPIDADQFVKVSNFKREIGQVGIYEEFDNLEGFKTKLLAALVKAIDRLEKKSDPNNGYKEVSPKKSDTSNMTEVLPIKTEVTSVGTEIIRISEFDEDIGIMDLTEMIYDAFEIFNDNLETMNTATVKLNSRISAKTEDIRNLKSTGDARKDQKNAKLIVETVAKEMQRYSYTLDQAIPNAKREFSSALRCMEHAVMISYQDGMGGDNEIKDFVAELISLRATLDRTYEQTATFRDALSATPRMNSALNQAKRRAVNSVNEVLSFISEASVNINVTLRSVEH